MSGVWKTRILPWNVLYQKWIRGFLLHQSGSQWFRDIHYQRVYMMNCWKKIKIGNITTQTKKPNIWQKINLMFVGFFPVKIIMFIFFRPASNSFCEANKYKTSLLNPSCRTGNPPRGTECIDCCKQYNCDPNDLYCNKKIIQSEHMPCTYCC